jgi:hypothetical protein
LWDRFCERKKTIPQQYKIVACSEREQAAACLISIYYNFPQLIRAFLKTKTSALLDGGFLDFSVVVVEGKLRFPSTTTTLIPKEPKWKAEVELYISDINYKIQFARFQELFISDRFCYNLGHCQS